MEMSAVAIGKILVFEKKEGKNSICWE